MPEGHTVHRLARDHAEWFAGGPVAVSSPQGRFDGAAVVDGRTLTDTDAYGKHLFHHYEDAPTVHVHLGLFGRFRRHRTAPPEPRPTVRMRVANGAHVVDLTGPTACELVTDEDATALVARLGPDPLRPDADPERGWQALQRRRVGIGQALLDQRVIAGVGNVFRAEVLAAQRIHPEVPAARITHAQWHAMWATLVGWMRRAVDLRRIVTVEPPPGRSPRSLARDERTLVYRHDRCGRCGAAVRRWDLAGRWAYACETCQPRPRSRRGDRRR